MPLTPGERLGSYEILAPIGAGGMGEVYRARDTRLGRAVALKTLPDSFTHDAERLARFRREAQVLASLNHPHIGSIYGLEETDGHYVLVLELIDGETLAQRIAQGPLPMDEALAIGREIAEALEAAHEKGIIHRDLKPANVALTAQDRVKVLDFGLAKATEGPAAVSDPDLMNSPTLTSPAVLTGVGVILGTAAYMSPEQAKGRVTDKRSDIWAFGCVLYEMLTGRRAFEGDDVSDTLAAVLKSDPDWSALPPSLAPSVRSLLEGCLRKDRRERIGDISTALFVLKHPLSAPAAPSVPGRTASPLWRGALLVLAGAALGAAAVAAILGRPSRPVLQITRFAIPILERHELTGARRAVAISPDGTRIVYSAAAGLFIRSVSDFESIPIPGANPAIQPAFSPDGQSIVFWADAALKRMPVTGGVPVTVCPTAPAPFGISWSDDRIAFVEPGRSIMRVSANGGTPTTLVRVNRAEGLVLGTEVLPDGDTVLFTLLRGGIPSPTAWDKAQIVVQSIRTGRRKVLIEGGSDARYVPTGHIVYLVEGTMVAVPFDLAKLEVTGGPVPVVEGVRRAAPAAGGQGQFAFSASGALAYVPGPSRVGQDQVYLYDRKGNAELLKLPQGAYSYPRVSPDGKWLALETSDGKEASVSVYEMSGTSSVRRLTFGGNNRLPIWSVDGRHIAFQSDREGDRAIFWQSIEGGTPERLTRPERGTVHVPEAWSPRGDVFLFSIQTESAVSLWTFSIRDRKASRFGDVTSSAFPTDAVFSPDGRLVAYQAGDSSTGEATLYVQPFPPRGTKYEIARGGRPLWSRDGKLFFIPAPSQFMAVSVRTEPTFAFSDPVQIPRRFGLAPPASPRPYDMLPDGRIVAVDAAGQGGAPVAQEIRVVQNWFEELKAKVPVK